MLGVELVTDRELKTPAKVETLHVMDQMKGKVSYLKVETLGFGVHYLNIFKPDLWRLTSDLNQLFLAINSSVFYVTNHLF